MKKDNRGYESKNEKSLNQDELNPRTDIIIRNIGDKIKENQVKKATIVYYCEELDKNHDGVVHIKDLEEILNHVLGNLKINTREIQVLLKYLHDPKDIRNKGSINYIKFLDIFHDELDISDRYYDNNRHNKKEIWNDNHHDIDDKWATKRGTIGEWLKQAACPAEVDNFRIFISCLEDYERRTGLKCIHKEDGLVIPMGPDLKASISYFMK